MRRFAFIQETKRQKGRQTGVRTEERKKGRGFDRGIYKTESQAER